MSHELPSVSHPAPAVPVAAKQSESKLVDCMCSLTINRQFVLKENFVECPTKLARLLQELKKLDAVLC